ncbi:MAG: hypothetical protein ACHQ49_11770 [Elusimicrobiota bacterium]
MDPLEPTPPRFVPPAPPRPEWIAPAPPGAAAPAPAPIPAATPVMEFFQRRLESLEKELALERERASAAQSLLGHQEALKNEVDDHLKALTDQLKREKLERDNEEARSHSRGRVEALEKRLDEMNSTFAQLLKEAVSARDGGASGSAREQKQFEEGAGRRLDEFSARLARSLEEWKREQAAARAELDARVEALARERADLARTWESQARALREENFKDRAAREADLSRRVGEISARLAEMSGAQESSARGAEPVLAGLERVIAILTATPKAKDAAIAELQQERRELAELARDRQDALSRFAEERRAVEKSMGEGLLRLTGELEDERARGRAAAAEAGARLGTVETLQARAADLERCVSDRDARIVQLCAERDELARSLVAEADKVRRGLEERRAADEETDKRIADLRKLLGDESVRRAAAEASAADARSHMASLAEQTARSLQERDGTLARYSDWEKERQRLLDTIRKKDEMISLLSSTFQGALKKGA